MREFILGRENLISVNVFTYNSKANQNVKFPDFLLQLAQHRNVKYPEKNSPLFLLSYV